MKYLSVAVLFKTIIVSLFLITGLIEDAIAYTGACTPDGGTYNYYDNFGMLTVVDPKGNKPGYLFPRSYNWNLGGSYTAPCDCDPESEDGVVGTIKATYFKTETTLPLGHTEGKLTFYKINDYLEVSTSVWIAGKRLAYIPTPWYDESNMYDNLGHWCAGSVVGHTDGYSSGSKGQLWLYISKPFVGVTYIENVKVIDIYGTLTPGSYGNTPMSSVWVNGQVSVPQNCIIDAGQLITVDFGKIWSGDFTTKGQKPVGYIEKKIKASMKCNNIAAYTNLTLRFQSEVSPDDSTFIKTDNADVGVELLDENGKLVLPNNGLMPFTINENYEASVSFQVAPVSTTGNVPTAGQFKALAYIRVDFA